MKESQFFEKQTISSKIKASIVSEYFPSYCKIIAKKHTPKEIRYIDLFAGPGLYKNEVPSTPILIARHCVQDEFLRNNVKMIFNDNVYYSELEENFLKEFPDGTFAKPQHFGKSTVGENKRIAEFLVKSTHNENDKNDYPSLLFIDPFGYKGIETRVLAEFLRNWGNEIFLFVNTKRIHPALENEKFEGLMKDLFPTTLDKIKNDRRFKSSVSQRLALIINSLGDEYQSLLGGKVFFTAFKFQEEDIATTSHYILHLTKGSRGYDLIKTTYNDFANVGTVFDGINTYTFDAKKFGHSINELFDLNSINVDKLKEDLQLAYKGKKITAFDLFETHHTNGLYSRNHYTEALRRLVDEGKLDSDYTDGKKHLKSVLLIKDCKLSFK
ncbi:three-Cys-motif partner protein TcmP [Negadavirga shengliensis]|uniref:Three-Cys-motif partner protein TcmP n=1 Tax=Negadavirga shengliensis TaxID=1389218 RepID=A0ABV9T949_9BACT